MAQWEKSRNETWKRWGRVRTRRTLPPFSYAIICARSVGSLVCEKKSDNLKQLSPSTFLQWVDRRRREPEINFVLKSENKFAFISHRASKLAQRTRVPILYAKRMKYVELSIWADTQVFSWLAAGVDDYEVVVDREKKSWKSDLTGRVNARNKLLSCTNSWWSNSQANI